MKRIKRRLTQNVSADLADFPEVFQRIFAARGITDKSLLDKDLKHLLPFTDLLNIEKAQVRLVQALQRHERILIVGDFDADGATSSALAVAALRQMGGLHVDYLVPNRFEFGYGLTPGIVDVAKRFQPNLIITVDNGIASFEGVAAANLLGIDVLVTDHHLPAETLPDAYAIVNPNQPGDAFKSKSIAGVGVIFYVMLALRQALRDVNWFEEQHIPEPNMAQFLDLVALGTFADVVPLDKNNRILVENGLKRIRRGQCRPGIRALIEISKRNMHELVESDLGFAVAPRLNAAGRLDDMSRGIACLLADTDKDAYLRAEELNELNIERRQIEAGMQKEAIEALEKITLDNANELPLGLCLVEKTWHQGVIGILAGRMKERYYRPVIAFAYISDDEMKGSARSIPGVNIRDVLARIDVRHPGTIQKFGGHAMAAGLSIHPSQFPHFSQYFVEALKEEAAALTAENVVLTDGALNASELNLDFAHLLQQEGPWGAQFPEPVFDNTFDILEQRLVGENHLKLRLKHEAGEILDAIAFNIDVNHWPNQHIKQARIAYTLGVNQYRGVKRLQLLVEAIESHG